MNLLSDAAQSETWPAIKPQLTKEKVIRPYVSLREYNAYIRPDSLLLPWLFSCV